MVKLLEIRVVVGIIQDSQQRILITQRPMHVPHGGFFEFPGGKMEALETPFQALQRELKEEINIIVREATFLKEIVHSYDDKIVHLLVFLVQNYTGTPTCLENQPDLRFVPKQELRQLKFPEANHAIVELLNNNSRSSYRKLESPFPLAGLGLGN